ncbi:MAG: carbon storage regulator [Tepidisphaeraceae bacterium]
MIVVSRKVDEWVQVGADLLVGPTDIDARTVRILVRGRMIGGPSDGLPFEAAHEMSRGQSFPIGPFIMVTCLDVRPPEVRLGFDAPRHLPVHTKEHADALRRKKDKGN